MGKRKQPFGYKMELGEIVPQPQEAETVRSIYLQYLAGASFKQLAEQLQTEDVPYDVDKPWNKNMVARILEDDRYIGEKYFPALIPTEQFRAAQERRKEMRPEYKQTPAQKELRKLCGGIVPDSVARRVLKILNQVVDDPQLIQNHHEAIISREQFDAVQMELARRRAQTGGTKKSAPTGMSRYSGKYALSGLLFCGECGTAYRRVVWTQHGEKRAVWRCSSRLD